VDDIVDDRFDVALVIGTEATFDYIREWARRARAGGAQLIEMNPKETALTPFVDSRLAQPTGEALYGILASQSG